MGLKLALLAMVAADGATAIISAADPGLDLVRELAQLDTPALLVLFIILLARGKIRWERDVKHAELETDAWKEAALQRTQDAERHVTVAEAAIRAAQRPPPAPPRR